MPAPYPEPRPPPCGSATSATRTKPIGLELVFRAVALLPLTVCCVLPCGIARPLRGDPHQLAQARNQRTLLIVLLLAIVVAWLFREVAWPSSFV
jgi:hypothetical protein